VFLAVLVIGAIGLVVAAARNDNRQVQSLGVSVSVPVGVVTPGGPELCQQPIGLGGRVEAVEFNPGAPPPTSALQLQLRDYASHRVLGSGVLRGGFDPAQPQTVAIQPPVPGNRQISLCVRNLGPAPMGIFGSPAENLPCSLRRGTSQCLFGQAQSASSVSRAFIGSQPLGGDIAAVFLRRHARSLTDRVVTVVRHASVFKPGFAGAGFWWLLIGLLVIAAPTMLVLTLRSLARAERTPPAGDPAP
jgi:hypothetical protein